MKQEAKKRIQEYLKKNDEQFETAETGKKAETKAIIVATNNNAVYTLNQALAFCKKFMDYPPQADEMTLTNFKLPGATQKTRGWIWQQLDGYFFIRCGSSEAYMIDRRFY